MSFTVYTNEPEFLKKHVKQCGDSMEAALLESMKKAGCKTKSLDLAKEIMAAAVSATFKLMTYEEAVMKKREEQKKQEEEKKEKGLEAKINSSAELKMMIEDMYKSLDSHVHVFPPAPQPGDLVVPTGGLAKCICSPGCTKELPQPAYRFLEEPSHDDDDEGGENGDTVRSEFMLAPIADILQLRIAEADIMMKKKEALMRQ